MPLSGVLCGGGPGAVHHHHHHHHHRNRIVISIGLIADANQTAQIQIVLGNWQAASGDSAGGGPGAVHLPRPHHCGDLILVDGQTLNNGLAGQFVLGNLPAAGGSSPAEETFDEILAKVTATSPASKPNVTAPPPQQTSPDTPNITAPAPSPDSSNIPAITTPVPTQSNPGPLHH